MTKKIALAKNVDGDEMGVFDDGTAYLSEVTLANWCGVSRQSVIAHAADWEANDPKNALASFLRSLGYGEPSLFVRLTVNGSALLAYPEVVCMAFLEYYAFLAKTPKAEAQSRYRAMARMTMRVFVYHKTGYNPAPQQWRQFHDRLMLNTVPAGYFSVFREMADFVLKAIQGGLELDADTVPDISVGRLWSDYWSTNDMEAEYGSRCRYSHSYPDYFPQSASNPQLAYAYPMKALGPFRLWLEEVYVPTYFSKYLSGKVKRGQLTAGDVPKILSATGASPLPPAAAPPQLAPKK